MPQTGCMSLKMSMAEATYADSTEAYRGSGLGFPLPVPRGRKAPPPTGFTGEGGAASEAQNKSAQYRKLRAKILKGQPPCHWCGVRIATEADHLHPASLGGQSTPDNLVPSCRPCNIRRGRILQTRIRNLERGGTNVAPRVKVHRSQRF